MPNGDSPTYQNLIDSISDLIRVVDENSKRELDTLRGDIALLRGELNDARKDMSLVRTEMNTLRVDMSDMRGSIERDMVACDKDQVKEIALIKQEAKIEGDRKAKIVGVIVSVIGLICATMMKVFGLI